ncbi:MAG: LysM peptidoglycan-binding domain-containing protein [Lachnospiraceae bacterium]|nr:LysM peptidoglycan-binding domain-containing protein [Lachnospiraceae bacterium]
MRRKKQFIKRICVLCAAALLMSSMSAVTVYASQDAPEPVLEESTNTSYVDWHWTLYELTSGKHEAIAAGKSVIDLVTGTDTIVPMAVVNEAVNRDLILAFHTGTGMCFSVNGSRVSPVSENLNLVTNGAVAISQALITEVSRDAIATRGVHMDASGFPIEIEMHFSLGTENVGKYANLYHYNAVENKLTCVGTFRITENGQAAFPITVGGDYFVTVTEKEASAKSIAITEDEKVVKEQIYVVQSGDNLTKIALKHAVTLKELLAGNAQITNPNRIYKGQEIVIMK